MHPHSIKSVDVGIEFIPSGFDEISAKLIKKNTEPPIIEW